jgi:hypothetical protein
MTKFLRGAKHLLKAFFRRCVLLAQWTWSWVQYMAQILMPLRFNIVTIFLVALLFLWSAPGKDLLLSMADQEHLLKSKVILYYFASLFIWAMCLWYWSRVMMRFVHDDFFNSPDDAERKKKRKVALLSWFRKHIPRLMGLAPFIIMLFAFPVAGRVYSEQTSKILQGNLDYLWWVSLGLGGLYYLIVFYRRRVIYRHYDPEQIERHYAPSYKDWHDLGRTSFSILFATLSLSAVVFVVVCINPQSATSLGTGSVLFLASASWVAFGSTMVSLGKGFKFPIISTALIGAVIIGPYTDNHQVRTLKAKSPVTAQGTSHKAWHERPTLKQDFEEWMATRAAVFDKKRDIHPIFIVAAEGGGIRAAYWTANLLAALQDTNENFANHVYALSGISGGSLGTALFVNLLKDQKNMNCDVPENDWRIKKNRKCAHAILSEDFLTPTVASMLYPDLIQRINFLSFVHKFPDRAYALETTFEKAWKMHLHNDRFSRSFLELWDIPSNSDGNLKFHLPALFLNSTWVEGGKRVIASNVQILKEHFPDAEDLFSILCAEIPLSTAVHNSARFSYVSPAGTMEEPLLDGEPCRQRLAEFEEDPDKNMPISKIRDLAVKDDVPHQVWGHVVDGGYFENSGNTTAYDILSTIEDEFKGNGDNDEGLICGPEDKPELQFKCIPVVITLINDPALIDASKTDPDDSARSHEGHLPQELGHPDPDRYMTETLSPLKTLFQTRDGRGSYARDSTRKYVEGQLGGLSLKFSLHDEKGALPLSWVLSDLVKDNIQKQVDEVLVDLGKPINPEEEGLEKPEGPVQKFGDPLNLEHLISYRIRSG